MKIFISFLISLVFYNADYAQNLKIEIFNKTSYDIDSLVIDDIYVGSIKKGQKFLVLECKEITIQDRLPYGFPDGVIKNKKRTTELFGLCGTGRTSVTTGHFKFDITVTENENGYRLFWDYHK